MLTVPDAHQAFRVAMAEELDLRGVTSHSLPIANSAALVKVDWLFVFASAAFNLIQLPKLPPRPA